MRQAIMVKPGVIEYREVPEQNPGPGQVKIKIKRIGICGSDIHVYHGLHPFTSYPVVQGHEVSAQVAELGAGVEGYQVGDKVTVQPQVVCGTCYPCTHGLYNDCEVLKVMGFQTTGMASDTFVVDAGKLVKLPPGMGWDEGAIIEPVAVAVHAINRLPDIQGRNVLVLGGGPIGNLVAQAAKGMGAGKVLLSEISPFRLQTAQDCGLDTVNPAQEDLGERVLSFFGKDKADYILECVGSSVTLNQAICVARKGSTIVSVGVVADEGVIEMSKVQDHELSLLGSAMYREEDFVQAIQLVNEGKMQLLQLVTHHFPFEEFSAAYQAIVKEKDQAMKVIVVLDD